MQPIDFKEKNITMKGDGVRSVDMPAHYDGETGVVTSCHKLDLNEVHELVENGVLFLQVMTFGEPMQPVKILIKNPLKDNG